MPRQSHLFQQKIIYGNYLFNEFHDDASMYIVRVRCKNLRQNLFDDLLLLLCNFDKNEVLCINFHINYFMMLLKCVLIYTTENFF